MAPSVSGARSYGHQANSAYGFSGQSQQTRHARRLYVGGIGEISEPEITAFFNDVIDRALGEKQEGGSVVSVYINRERHFAFVELRTIELTTACMNLDGVSYNGQPLKIRRPNDYNPATVPTIWDRSRSSTWRLWASFLPLSATVQARFSSVVCRTTSTRSR
jgi:RNA recognition motif-containing protein